MKNKKVELRLSLREARVLARALTVANGLVYDTRRPFGDQSELYRLVCRVEWALKEAVGRVTLDRFGNSYSGYTVAGRWLNEPLSAPFSRTVARLVEWEVA